MSHKFYKPAKSRLQRSELAVPGSSPKMFEKALNSNADYIFLDLEDAVSPNDKVPARANVIKALNEMNWREKGKTISVRINSLDTHYMYSDLVEIVEQAGENVDTILIPKAGTSQVNLNYDNKGNLFGIYSYSLSNVFQLELINVGSFGELNFSEDKNSNLFSTNFLIVSLLISLIISFKNPFINNCVASFLVKPLVIK